MSQKKTVKILFSVPLEVEVTADWNKDMIEFHYNESSHCLGNEWEAIRDKIDAMGGETGCLCHEAKVTLIET